MKETTKIERHPNAKEAKKKKFREKKLKTEILCFYKKT